jgi:hypothetical protein
MAALPSVAGWLAASTRVRSPPGVLAPGIGQALIGAGGDRAGAGLLGLVVQLPLPGLHPGLDGPAGDRRRHAAGTAAGSVQAGTATTVAKAADGQVEMIRSLRLVRRSAIKARTQAANQLQSLLVTAPDELREQLRRLPLDRLVDAAAKLDLGQVTTVAAASRLALRSVAGRNQQLSAEVAALDEQLDRLVAKVAPALLAVHGVGTDTAAALLIAAGDNPTGCAARPRSRTCAGWRRSPPRRARPSGIGCTAAATVTPTGRCGWSRWDACAGTRAPAPT